MDSNIIKNISRIGVVSSVDTKSMTARVKFPDSDNIESFSLHLLNRGSKKHKDYWIPAVDEQVLCLYVANTGGRGVGEGFILGSWFSDVDIPVKTGTDIRRVDFGDGSFIEHDGETGNITIHAMGDVIITGANIKLN